MAKRVVDVKIETSIDLNMAKRLDAVAVGIFETEATSMLRAIKNQWKGWRYEGMSPRAKSTRTGRSRRSWRFSVQATEDPRRLTFINDARDYYSDKPYSAYVGRTKTAIKEWLLVRDMLVEKNLPRLRDRMVQAVQDALRTPGRYVKVRANKSTTFRELTLS
jgi:hypothetical protein